MYIKSSILASALSTTTLAYIHLPLGQAPASAKQLRSRQASALNNPLTTNGQTQFGFKYSVGSPPQPQFWGIDTGSSFPVTAGFNSSGCANNVCVDGVFTPSDSSTYQFLGGSCSENFIGGSGATSSFQFTDDFTLDGVTVTDVEFCYDESGIGGIVGLNFFNGTQNPPPFVAALRNQGKINRSAFSIWLNNGNDNGEITFGGVDPSKYTGDFVDTAMVPSADGVNYDNLRVAFTGLNLIDAEGAAHSLAPANYPGRAPAIDTGDPGVSLPIDMYNSLFPALGVVNDTSSGLKAVPCDLQHSPATLQFQFGGTNGIDIDIPLSNFVTTQFPEPIILPNGTAVPACRLNIDTDAADTGLIGRPVQFYMYNVFDLENKRIAIASASQGTPGTPAVTSMAVGSGIPGAARQVSTYPPIPASATDAILTVTQTTTVASGTTGLVYSTPLYNLGVGNPGPGGSKSTTTTSTTTRATTSSATTTSTLTTTTTQASTSSTSQSTSQSTTSSTTSQITSASTTPQTSSVSTSTPYLGNSTTTSSTSAGSTSSASTTITTTSSTTSRFSSTWSSTSSATTSSLSTTTLNTLTTTWSTYATQSTWSTLSTVSLSLSSSWDNGGGFFQQSTSGWVDPSWTSTTSASGSNSRDGQWTTRTTTSCGKSQTTSFASDQDWATTTENADPTWLDWSSTTTSTKHTDPSSTWADWTTSTTAVADPTWLNWSLTTTNTKKSEPSSSWADWTTSTNPTADPTWNDWSSTAITTTKRTDPTATWADWTTSAAEPTWSDWTSAGPTHKTSPNGPATNTWSDWQSVAPSTPTGVPRSSPVGGQGSAVWSIPTGASSSSQIGGHGSAAWPTPTSAIGGSRTPSFSTPPMDGWSSTVTTLTKPTTTGVIGAVGTSSSGVAAWAPSGTAVNPAQFTGAASRLRIAGYLVAGAVVGLAL